MLSPQTILQNRYLILRQLGHGGMGTVYEATDRRLNITVALKETHFADVRLRKQFEREAHLLARLHHPALPKVSDHFIEDNGQYLVMHFIPGNDLWQMLKSRRVPFKLDKVLGWADQLLDVLDYLHRQEPPIIHRDIKPQNLKLNERGQIILLDFGLAKGFAGEISHVTISGSIYGFTPNYAPLEQVQGEGTDPRSDLYSLAATLYHLASGKVPSDVRKRVTAWTDGQPDPLQPAHEVNPQVPRVISNILSDALAIGRSQRPASAADMRRALQEAARSLKYGEIEEVETSLETIPPTDFSKLSSGQEHDSSQSITAESLSAPELLKTVSAETPPNFAASAHSSSPPLSTPTRWRSRPFSTLARKLNARSWLFWSCVGLGIAITVFAVLLIAKKYSKDAEREAYFGIIAPPEGQILRYASGVEPETLDPQLVAAPLEMRIAIALFDGLVEYSETTTAPRPSLATNWDVNADHTVWTFHLRRDARWSDNEPLTAKDFIYSWRRLIAPDFSSPNMLLHYIKNARPYMKQLAYVYDPLTGKYATEADLERSGKSGQITFTGVAPTSSKTKAKYLFVPINDEEREKMFIKKPALRQLTKDKQLMPVKRDEIGLRALDDYTIEVTLEEPSPFFIKVVLHPIFRPVPRQSVEKWGDSQWAMPGRIVTSGAFKLAEWIPEQRVVVERNTSFWDSPNTKLDKIIFLALKEPATAMDLYKAGEVDATATGQIPARLYNQLKDKKDFVAAPYLNIMYFTINATMPPLNDVRVRRALSMAINRQAIADQSPGRQPLTGFVPLMVGYQVAKGADYNPNEARRLLSEAGFPGGRGFPEIEILYNPHSANQQIVEAVQVMLQRELGIKITLALQDWRTFLRNRETGNYKGLARAGWIGDYADPNAYFNLFISNAEQPTGINWQDSKFDEMLREANAETDPDKRAMMLRDVEKYLLDVQPIIPIHFAMNSFMRKPYVRNFEPNLLDVHDWRGVYIEHSAKQ